MSQTITLEPLMKSSTFCKMMFFMNALDEGWTIKKKGTSYIFTKKHENKHEVFDDKYIHTFLEANYTWRSHLQNICSEIKNN